MKLFSKSDNLIQRDQKLSTQFAWITTALIAIVSLLISVSVMRYFGEIIIDLQNQSKLQDLYISSKVFDDVITYIDKDRTEMEKIIMPAFQNQAIANIIVKDKKTGKVVYNLDGEKRFKHIKREHQFYAPIFTSDKYMVKIGFYEKNIVSKYATAFLNKLSALTAACIFFGLLMSYLMFNIINKPFLDLIKAAEKFKCGNFTNKLEKTHYQEINTLIDTYNSMADSLNELYSSLEMKVEERTLELEKAYKDLKEAQTIMVHSEKMRSLGELVAGVTHEINNPVNFIYGNLVHLKNYTSDLINFIEKLITLANIEDENIKNQLEELKSEYDYEFIKDDLPALISSCQEGAERTKNIIMNLKDFSRMGVNAASTVDLEHEIDVTLNILHNKLKNRITVTKDYTKEIPKIDAIAGQLNQVFMNILDNAAYAIKEQGNIKITMRYDEKYVIIKFEDDGCGMSEETKSKIFDPFYTTKPVGEGTGLGMAICYKIIANHNGKIEVESEENKGTTFIITLPIENKKVKNE